MVPLNELRYSKSKTSNQNKLVFLWMPQSLSELTTIILNMRLTHLGLEASIYALKNRKKLKFSPCLVIKWV